MQELTTIIQVAIPCIVALLFYRVGYRDGVKSAQEKAGIEPPPPIPSRGIIIGNEVKKMLEELPESLDAYILKARYASASKSYVLGIIDMAEFDRVCRDIKAKIEG